MSRGTVHIDLFTSLDGVAQAPGGPEEDPEGGFALGGWQAPLIDDTTGAQVMAGIDALDALLLGRRTYDIFAAYWPFYEGESDPIARKLDAVPKYVASRGNPDLPWRDSHLLGPDLAAGVERLRDRHDSIHVIGSVDLTHTLIAANLFDVLSLWTYPVVLGSGKRVFPEGTAPTTLRLLEPPAPSPSGAVLLRYGPTGRGVETGTMG